MLGLEGSYTAKHEASFTIEAYDDEGQRKSKAKSMSTRYSRSKGQVKSKIKGKNKSVSKSMDNSKSSSKSSRKDTTQCKRKYNSKSQIRSNSKHVRQSKGYRGLSSKKTTSKGAAVTSLRSFLFRDDFIQGRKLFNGGNYVYEEIL